jgi:hypothetical protein
MAGNGSRGGAGRSAGGAVLDRKREQNVLAAINGSGGKAPYAVNNIRRTNRSEAQLRMLSQIKTLSPLVRAGLRNTANIRRANRLTSQANAYIQRSGGYYTDRTLKESTGRTYRQLLQGAETAVRARDYLAGKIKEARTPRNNVRPALATRAGRRARLEKFGRQRRAFGIRFALNNNGKRGTDGGNNIRRLRRTPRS